MHPIIEPYDHGMLAVGDGNAVYWEVGGNPSGKPALCVPRYTGAGGAPNRSGSARAGNEFGR